MVSTSDLRKGIAIELDGELWQVLDYHHIKMGRGSAQVRIKLRNIKRGQTVERTFQAGDKWPRAYLDKRQVQFLYRDGDDFHFMDTDSYDQFIAHGRPARGRRHLPQGRHAAGPHELRRRDHRRRAAHHHRPPGRPRPSPASRAIPPAGARKPATTETGLVVQVPHLRRGGRHHPHRHADRRVPDEGLTCDALAILIARRPRMAVAVVMVAACAASTGLVAATIELTARRLGLGDPGPKVGDRSSSASTPTRPRATAGSRRRASTTSVVRFVSEVYQQAHRLARTWSASAGPIRWTYEAVGEGRRRSRSPTSAAVTRRRPSRSP